MMEFLGWLVAFCGVGITWPQVFQPGRVSRLTYVFAGIVNAWYGLHGYLNEHYWMVFQSV